MLQNRFKEKWKHSFQKFSDYTSMHGFTELYYAKNIFWRCFWICIIGCAIGVTIYQVCAAVSQFVNQPTVTSIEAASASDMLYPPLRICYPHWLYWVDWRKGSDMNFTKAGMLYGLSYIDNTYSSAEINKKEAEENFRQGMVQNKLANILDFLQSIKSTSISSSNIEDAFNTTDFYVIDKSDSGNLNPVKLCHTLNENEIVAYIAKSQDTDTPDAVKIIKNKKRKTSKTNVLQFDISWPSDYRDIIDNSEYARYVQDWVMGEGYNTPVFSTDSWLSSITLPTLIYPNAYDPEPIMVWQDTDEVKISVKATIHKWKNTFESPCEKDWCWITFNKTCNKNCYKNFYGFLLNLNEMQSTLSAAVFTNNYTGVIKPTDIVRLKSEADMTTDSIQYEQTVDYNIQSSNDGVSVEQASASFNNCTKMCEDLTGCQVYTFDINQEPVSLFRSSNEFSQKFKTKVIIEYPTENEILIIKELDSKTWEDFVGNVGGLLGIWTGASILSFIQLFYLCCCADCDGCPIFSRTSNSKNMERNCRPKTVIVSTFVNNKPTYIS